MMLDEEDVLGSGFLSSKTSYFQTSFSPLYNSGEEDPWGSSFAPVTIQKEPLADSLAVDDDILEAGVTAASVLVGIDLPEIFDTAYIQAGPVDDHVSLASLEQLLRLGLPAQTVDKITSLVVPMNEQYVTRDEFNTALALMACAQKHMGDPSLETVYHHRKDLPVPMLPNLEHMHAKNNASTSTKLDGRGQKSKMDDPWRLPQNTTADVNTAPTQSNLQQSKSNSTINEEEQAPQPKPMQHDVKVSAESCQWFNNVDRVSVTTAPEKEGFIFKHINYVVQSDQQTSLVLRRYSDFYWLWETLMRRYPFRMIPNLPPKKLGSRDDLFLERRRKGLLRFINGIVRHPALKVDEVVHIFLTEPSELLAWRKANPPTTDEEFIRKSPNTDDLESYIPPDLLDRLEKVERRLPTVIAHYQSLCATVERTIRLKEARGNEFERYSATLDTLSEVEHDCHVTGCHACDKVIVGYGAMAKHMRAAQSVLNDHAMASADIDGLLGKLKRHLDILVSFKDMLERRAKQSDNQMDALSKKIIANRAKANQNRGVPGLESEVDRLDTVIQSDTERLTYQQRRDTFIRYCLTSELSYVHKQQALVAAMYQAHVDEELKFARREVDNWKALRALTCHMPEPEEFA